MLCFTDNYSKYVRVTSSKYKIGIRITKSLQKLLDASNCKPNKIWVVECSEFSNRSMKSCLKDNDTEDYSAHNEGKLLLLKDLLEFWKIKFTTWLLISKNVYMGKLNDRIDKYKKKYHRKVKVQDQRIYWLWWWK